MPHAADTDPSVPDDTIRLTGDASLPRQLVVTVSSFGNLIAAIYAIGRDGSARNIVYVIRPIADQCRLVCDDGTYSLWLGRAAFDLTPAEAARLHAKFAPCGLASDYER